MKPYEKKNKNKIRTKKKGEIKNDKENQFDKR
jgi:hypothetical protein